MGLGEGVLYCFPTEGRSGWPRRPLLLCWERDERKRMGWDCEPGGGLWGWGGGVSEGRACAVFAVVNSYVSYTSALLSVCPHTGRQSSTHLHPPPKHGYLPVVAAAQRLRLLLCDESTMQAHAVCLEMRRGGGIRPASDVLGAKGSQRSKKPT